MKLKLFGVTFLLWLIPNFFVFIGQSNAAPKWLINNLLFLKDVEPDSLKDWCTVIGLIFTGLVLPYTLASLKETQKKQQEALNEILFSWKESLCEVCEDIIKRSPYPLSVRIFVRKKWYQYPPNDWSKVLRGEKLQFVLVNLPNLAGQDNTNGLSFEVKPTSQGVVGMIYNQDAVIIDYQIATNRPRYNLTNFQAQKVNHIKFVMGGPVYDSKNNGSASSKIIGLISFDSNQPMRPLTQDQEQKLKQIVVKYSDLIHKYLPLLTAKSQ